MRRWTITGVAAAVLYVLAPPGQAAGAAEAAEYTQADQVITSRLPTNGWAYPVLRLAGLDLRGGEPKVFYGKYTATKVVNEPVEPGDRLDMLQETWITCNTGEPTATQGYPTRSAMSSRNHESEAGTRRAISVLWLFTPPADGRYDCVLWGLGKATIVSPERWIEVIEDPELTQLRMWNETETGGEEWYQPTDVHLCLDVPETAGCEPTGEVLRHRWTARDEATSIDVFHGTQASSDSGGHDPFVIGATLRVTQLTGTGTACAPATTDDVTAEIPGRVHHLKINRRVNGIPIRTGNGCTRTFDITVAVRYILTRPPDVTPNRPGLVHGPVPVSPPLRPYSTAIAMNNGD